MGDRLQAGKQSWYVNRGQLSLAIPPSVGTMSTSESWDVNRHTVRCTHPVSVVWQCKLVSGWGLRKRRSVAPYGPYVSGRTLRFSIVWNTVKIIVLIQLKDNLLKNKNYADKKKAAEDGSIWRTLTQVCHKSAKSHLCERTRKDDKKTDKAELLLFRHYLVARRIFLVWSTTMSLM